MIIGGQGLTNIILNSVELINLRTNHTTSFGTLSFPVRGIVGGFINGFPFYCGGISSVVSLENRCYKFDQSWKQVTLVYVCFVKIC
jgi:hypothetical protein